MQPPFPGMDPYLEDPHIWPDVHHRLITSVCDPVSYTHLDVYKRQALHTAGAARARHLRARRMLPLPQPDDPSVPERNGALRRIREGR